MYSVSVDGPHAIVTLHLICVRGPYGVLPPHSWLMHEWPPLTHHLQIKPLKITGVIRVRIELR